jgi:hypothetical protein
MNGYRGSISMSVCTITAAAQIRVTHLWSVGLLRGQAVLVFREQFRALLEKPFPIPFIAHTASLAWVKALRQRDEDRLDAGEGDGEHASSAARHGCHRPVRP